MDCSCRAGDVERRRGSGEVDALHGVHGVGRGRDGGAGAVRCGDVVGVCCTGGPAIPGEALLPGGQRAETQRAGDAAIRAEDCDGGILRGAGEGKCALRCTAAASDKIIPRDGDLLADQRRGLRHLCRAGAGGEVTELGVERIDAIHRGDCGKFRRHLRRVRRRCRGLILQLCGE